MEKPKHIEFLEFLEPVDGLPKEKLIRSFMIKNFEKPKDLSEFADNEKEPGKQMLLDLLDDGQIEANELDILHVCNKDWVDHRGLEKYQQWFDTLHVAVKITQHGLDELEEYRNNHLISETLRSNKETTDAVKKNIDTQTILGIVSTTAIIAAAVIAFMAYNKDDPKSLILISKSMQKQEQILQSIQQSQKEIDASLAIMAKKVAQKE